MDFSLTPAQEEFRERVRSWLAANIPREWSRRMGATSEVPRPEAYELLRRWQRQLFDAGFIGLTWPKEYGGAGLTFMEEMILHREMALAKAPPILNILGVGMAGPTIIAYGTEEQKQRYPARILSCEEIWCQGYSEPNAGSDLASLQTRAVKDGDHWVINGQKVWTSLAHVADWMMLLARTDPDAPKHKGITYFLLDMKLPGVTVKPLRQMTGDAEFNEVFFDNVRVHESQVLGGVNDGWAVGMTTLMYERLALGFGLQVRLRIAVDALIEMARQMDKAGRPATSDPVMRQKIAQLWIDTEALRCTGARAVTKLLRGELPGPEASTGKMGWVETHQRLQELAMELQGPYAQLFRGSDRAVEGGVWQYTFLRSRANSIEGGTTEIQKNIIGERVLGLAKGVDAMDFGFNEEQELLRSTARKFLENECTSEIVRTRMAEPAGVTDELWGKVAEQGWLGLIYPEEYGGSGLGFVDLTVLMEEMGRAVMPGPFFSTVLLGGLTILEAGSAAQKKEWLAKIAAGEAKVTLALTEPNARWDAGGITTIARKSGGGWVLSGTKLFVLDAHIADALIVVARVGESKRPEEGISLFLVPRGAQGVSVTLLPTMDQTRKLCEVALNDVRVPAEALLGAEGAGWSPVTRVIERATAALCAEMCGGAQRVLDMTTEYAKIRTAFGRPIGSYQGVKHKAADMLVDVENAKSLTYYAAWAVDENVPEAPLAVSMAKAYVSDAYRKVAGAGIQLHGGIGFTWEHDLHLYFKRAKSSEFTFGDATYHRERVAQLISL